MKQEPSALVSSDYEKLPKEMRKTNDTTFDRIYKYYFNDKSRVELTVEEGNIRTRWEKAWYFMCRHRTRKQVADLLQKTFNISRALAFDDVSKASLLFGDPDSQSKEAKRSIAESMILQAADRCWKIGNMDQYEKLIGRYMKLHGLENETNELDMAEMLKKFKPTQITITASKEELQKQMRKMQEEIAQDITHEDA